MNRVASGLDRDAMTADLLQNEVNLVLVKSFSHDLKRSVDLRRADVESHFGGFGGKLP